MSKMTSFHHREDDEENLGPEVPYFSAISVMTFLANCMRSDIAFQLTYLQDMVMHQFEDKGMGQIYMTLPP
jgi:hypothetical protein